MLNGYHRHGTVLHTCYRIYKLPTRQDPEVQQKEKGDPSKQTAVFDCLQEIAIAIITRFTCEKPQSWHQYFAHDLFSLTFPSHEKLKKHILECIKSTLSTVKKNNAQESTDISALEFPKHFVDLISVPNLGHSKNPASPTIQ